MDIFNRSEMVCLHEWLIGWVPWHSDPNPAALFTGIDKPTVEKQARHGRFGRNRKKGGAEQGDVAGDHRLLGYLRHESGIF